MANEQGGDQRVPGFSAWGDFDRKEPADGGKVAAHTVCWRILAAIGDFQAEREKGK